MTKARKQHLDWDMILKAAKGIVESYATGVTLRQLFYRLVSKRLIPNAQVAYKTLSAKTAEARRNNAFPRLIDRGRQIKVVETYRDAADAVAQTGRYFRLDRTIGQRVSIYLGVEKAGIVNQLWAWFADLGIPILALGGYSSQTFCDDVSADMEARDRPAVLIYAGDHDPSGEDIDRDFTARTNSFEAVRRIALNAEQVDEYSLPPLPGKETDARAAAFEARHGRLVQVELDALDPDILRKLYQHAIDEFWEDGAYTEMIAKEDIERRRIKTVKAARADGGGELGSETP